MVFLVVELGKDTFETEEFFGDGKDLLLDQLMKPLPRAEDPRTAQNYKVSGLDSTRNKAGRVVYFF